MRPAAHPAAAAEARLLAAAFRFLTRLPMPDPGWEDGLLLRASRYFALVGIAVGAIAAAVWLVAGAVLPPAAAAILALGAGIVATGGLHEDALADTADGLGAHADAARTLEIMRDSRTGAFGVLALLAAGGLRVAALAAMPLAEGALALIAAAAIGRAAMVPVTRLARPAAGTGLGASMAAGAGRVETAAALGTATAVALLCGSAGAAALLAAGGAAAALAWLVVRRLGGYTGDGLGAVCVAAETAALLALAAAWGLP